MSKAHVLVVDDDIPILTALKKTLSLEGYAVDVAGAVGIAEEHLAKRSYDIALFDVALPDGDGVSLLERLRKAKNDIPVVMMSGHATVDAAVRATRLGAIDFLEKPLSTDRLLLVVENTLRLVKAEAESRELRRATGWGGDMVGSSRAMQVLRDQMGRAAKSQASVL
ncbi:MAG TPA: response regulator, partial [Polyangiaceae bacterium]|nr:response regulator [Polyangiaceae bacterium]